MLCWDRPITKDVFHVAFTPDFLRNPDSNSHQLLTRAAAEFTAGDNTGFSLAVARFLLCHNGIKYSLEKARRCGKPTLTITTGSC
jgi:hypothetical protein